MSKKESGQEKTPEPMNRDADTDTTITDLVCDLDRIDMKIMLLMGDGKPVKV